MAAAARSRLQLDERRAQLLALGLEMFSERSYESISIDDIAEAAGISKGLLYHYFGGKKDFYTEVVRYAAKQLEVAVEPDMARPPAERAVRGLKAYLDFVEQRADAFLALMRSAPGADEEVGRIVESARAHMVERMLAGLGVDASRAVFRLAARGWVGQVEAASLDWLEHRDVPRDRLEELLLRSLYEVVMLATEMDPDAGVVLET